MHYLSSIIGEPVLRMAAEGGAAAAVLTEKGFAVCDPMAIDTGWRKPDSADDVARCELRRGHVYIRTCLPDGEGVESPEWSLSQISGWVVILPFQDLPAESRAAISRTLPAGFEMPAPSVRILQKAAEAYRMETRRVLRLRDALADAGFASLVTLQPTGLHSTPLRVYGKSRLRPLTLPADYRLNALLMNWSGKKEVVRFEERFMPVAI